MTADELIIVGRITGLFGVKGWVKVYSHTQPRDKLISYNPWLLDLGGSWQPYSLTEGRRHGKSLIARFEGYSSRDQVVGLLGAEVAISADQLERLPEGEYYWLDLIGLQVVNLRGIKLGTVDHLIETGANDVLVVKGECEILIPYLETRTIKHVDLERGIIRVDWELDWMR